jgi:hypothetical protein
MLIKFCRWNSGSSGVEIKWAWALRVSLSSPTGPGLESMGFGLRPNFFFISPCTRQFSPLTFQHLFLSFSVLLPTPMYLMTRPIGLLTLLTRSEFWLLLFPIWPVLNPYSSSLFSFFFPCKPAARASLLLFSFFSFSF